MRSNLNNIQKFIESAFLVLLLLGLFVGNGSAAPITGPSATSYWGYVTNNSIPEPNALITVYNSSGNLVANATSNQDKQYQVTVPRYDPTTSPGGVVDGETITFKVDGQVATSRVVDLQGTNNRLDLAVPTATSTPPSSGGGGGGGSSSGGGGGGGGGGTSGENYSNIIIKEKHDLFIFKDTVTSYRFNSTDPIIYVNITGNNNAGEINAMVEVLRDTSTIAKVPAPGTVYKNVNIWVGTGGFAVPRNIKEGIIGFKVTNSWLKSNGLKAGDISMFRWNASWGKLETRMTGSDTDFTYFEAKTNAFSPFAIVAGAPGAVPTETVSTPGPAETSTATATATPPGTTPGSNLGIIIALIIIVIIAVAAYYFMVMKKKEGQTK